MHVKHVCSASLYEGSPKVGHIYFNDSYIKSHYVYTYV